jgi:hypothetical protein
MNSRGRQPTEKAWKPVRPLRGRTIDFPVTVGFTHGYSPLAASRPMGGAKMQFCHRAVAKPGINWAAMRKRKIIAIIAIVLFGMALTVFLLTRDTGPPVVVTGNFSVQDVAQIKGEVRRELWREVLPSFSKETIIELPRQARRAFTTHVGEIRSFNAASPGSSNKAIASIVVGKNYVIVYAFTNGPSGWRFDQNPLILH